MNAPPRMRDDSAFRKAFAQETETLHLHDLGRLRDAVVRAAALPTASWASVAVGTAVAVLAVATIAVRILPAAPIPLPKAAQSSIPASVVPVVQPVEKSAVPLVTPQVTVLEKAPKHRVIRSTDSSLMTVPGPTAPSALEAELASYRAGESALARSDVAAAERIEAHLAAFPTGQLHLEAQLLQLECAIRQERWAAVVAEADGLLDDLEPGKRQEEVRAARDRALERLIR